ncbi:hypothetical protein, partial [Ruegeria sp. HKCCD6604]|uniref:P-loop NTPase n=1 Tax=Ruegeria sp. HKCCD6604 TaxID=2683000 RepID=UPI00149284EE
MKKRQGQGGRRNYDAVVSGQRYRLATLRNEYPFGLLNSDTALYAALGLKGAGLGSLASKTGYVRPIDKALSATLPTMSLETLKRRFAISSNGSAKVNQHPFEKNLCDGLGWVFASDCELWNREQKLDDAFFNEKRSQISQFLQTGKPQLAEILFGLKTAWAREITSQSLNRRASPAECKEFLSGDRPPDLRFVISDASISRGDIEKDFYKDIVEKRSRCFLLTSSAGDGKSTLLLRLAFQAKKDGFRVYFADSSCHNNHRFRFKLGISEEDRGVLFVDDAHTIVDPTVIPMWLDENPGIQLVLASREINWNFAKASSQDLKARRFQIPRLTDKGAQRIARKYVQFDVVPGASEEQNLTAFRNATHGAEFPHFLAAAMSVSKGKEFREIIETMVEGFPFRDILAATALCQCADDGSNDLLCSRPVLRATRSKSDGTSATHLSIKKFNEDFRKVSSEIVPVGGSRYALRHPDIAQIALERLFGPLAGGTFADTSEFFNEFANLQRAVVDTKLYGNQHEQRNVPSIAGLLRFYIQSNFLTDAIVILDLLSDLKNYLGAEQSNRLIFYHVFSSVFDVFVEAAEKNETILEEVISEAQTCIEELCVAPDESSDTEDVRDRLDRALFALFGLRQKLRLKSEKFEDGDPQFRAIIENEFWEFWKFRAGKFKGLVIFRDYGLPFAETFYEDGGSEFVRSILIDLHNDDKLSPAIVIFWIGSIAEEYHFGVGEMVEPAELTNRWLLRVASEATDFSNSQLSVLYCSFESMQPDAFIGSIRDESGVVIEPEEWSARWVLRKAIEKKSFNDSGVVQSLVTLEMAQSDAFIGSVRDESGVAIEPEEWSARWVLRKAIEKKSFNDSGVVQSLVTLEMAQSDAFIGSVRDESGVAIEPEEWSARWVLRKTIEKKSFNDSGVVQSLVTLEMAQSDAFIGSIRDESGVAIEPEEWSARWV